MGYIQNPQQKRPPIDRKEHVWQATKDGWWKCVLCGAITRQPPEYPTPKGWMPERFEKLTEAERCLCPSPNP